MSCTKCYIIRFYINVKPTVVDVLLAIPFALEKLFLWWRMKKDLNIRKLMKASVFVATSASMYARLKSINWLTGYGRNVMRSKSILWKLYEVSTKK